MIRYNIYNSVNSLGKIEKDKIVEFLFEHLDQYGDKKEDIARCLDYAVKKTTYLPDAVAMGGFIITAEEEKEIIGSVVINKTGMKGYIPENILVYIAMHKKARGKGIGKALMQKAIDLADGDIALHVEKDNPARFLYEKLGFTNPYLEMRLKKQSK
ncbi:MAG: GNAT family N-acetyltransferase [Bacteroidales bacterium]|nr:GNAT family N-acetyltransferase [Bacteroidales bacterium]